MTLHIPVLVLGGGPVGLLLAHLLGRYGVGTLLVEKRLQVLAHPKARGLNTRTMEIFQRCGLEAAIRRHELPAQARCFLWLESLQGEEVAVVSANLTPSPHSSTTPCLVGQNHVEEVLRASLVGLPSVKTRYGVAVTELNEEGDGVRVTVEDQATGSRESIVADYVLAADGASSFTRQALGIGMQGPADLGRYCDVYCRMDLTPWLGGRESAGIFFADKNLNKHYLRAVNGSDLWLFGTRAEPGGDYSSEACAQLIRTCLRLDETTPLEVLSITFWSLGAQVAEAFDKGRVFLVGDAAHRIPPTGGFGLNVGLQAAHNLAWKVAATLAAHSGKVLLASYGEERKRVAQQVIDWSLRNAQRFTAIAQALAQDDKDALRKELRDQHQHVDNEGLDLGITYQSSVIADDAALPPFDPAHYRPSAEPGCRLPFLPLSHQDRSSTHDLLDGGFLLLVGEQKARWQAAAAKAAPGVKLTVYELGDQPRLGLGPKGGALLVRPDGFVAWRRTSATPEGVDLGAVLAQALGRGP